MVDEKKTIAIPARLRTPLRWSLIALGYVVAFLALHYRLVFEQTALGWDACENVTKNLLDDSG